VRQLLSDVASYLADLLTAAHRGWNAFFLSAADPTSVGLIRIATGLLAFWSLLVFGLDLQDYFGSTGWAEPGAIRALARPSSWSFWFLVPDGLLSPVWLACVVVLGLFTVGLFSRLTAVLSWVIVVSTARRVPIALYGFDQVLSVLLLYLAACGASGQAVSLDRFWRRWRQARSAAAIHAERRSGARGRLELSDLPAVPRPAVSANLCLRLIQLHLVLIYGMAGLGKLQGPSWWNGNAIWKTMTTGEFVVLDFTALAAWPLVINFLTHISIALELLYPVVIWVRILRPLVLAGMIALHLGIAVMSPGLTEFALAMMAGNLAFVSGPWLRRLLTGPVQPELKVLFNGACPRCRASVALITAADPDHVVEPVDLTAVDVKSIDPSLTLADCMRSMHAVSRAGQVTSGFDAVRAIALRLPLFWLPAVLGSLPGVAWTGRRVYNALAATRPRDVTCTDQVCGIHSRTRPTALRPPEYAQDRHDAIANMKDTR
jgi:predicted DCC family thiol-disulfide oxidoreductase YuxK